jgi:hypothetical protein
MSTYKDYGHRIKRRACYEVIVRDGSHVASFMYMHEAQGYIKIQALGGACIRNTQTHEEREYSYSS